MPGPRVVPRLGKRGGLTYIDKVLGIDTSIVALWPLWEAAGLVANCLVNPAQNGTYAGVTLGQPGIGDGNTAPLFDGANDQCNVSSAALSAAFPYNEGTLSIWWKVFNVGVWTDGMFRWACQFRNNTIPEFASIYKVDSDNDWTYTYSTNGNAKTVDLATTPVIWQHAGLTWSLGDGEVIAYHNGVQTGLTQVNADAWVNQTLDAFRTMIGAWAPGPTFPWYGWLYCCALWDTALAPAKMLAVATV